MVQDDEMGTMHGGEVKILPQPSHSPVRQEIVVQRTVRVVGGANRSVLTCTNYGECAHEGQAQSTEALAGHRAAKLLTSAPGCRCPKHLFPGAGGR